MVRIDDPELQVEQVDGAPGRRRLVVSYRLTTDVGEGEITERAVVTSRHVLDTQLAPVPLSVEVSHRGQLAGSGTERRLVVEVDRADLDVQQDWWRTDHGGGVEPIAELVDHLGAEITVEVTGEAPVSAKTPVISGSWGALGAD